jgi:hypothetical protein
MNKTRRNKARKRQRVRRLGLFSEATLVSGYEFKWSGANAKKLRGLRQLVTIGTVLP